MEFLIETPRLLIRGFKPEDAKVFFEITRDPDIEQYIPGAYYETLEETQENIKRYYCSCDFKYAFYVLLEEKKSHTVVGYIDLTLNQYVSNYDCCYFVHKNYRRSGYLKEALPIFLKKAYSICKKDIFFTIEKSNTPSYNFISNVEGIVEVTDSAFYVFKYQGVGKK